MIHKKKICIFITLQILIIGCSNKDLQFNGLRIGERYFSIEDTQILRKTISFAKVKRIYISDVPNVILYYKNNMEKDGFLSVYLKEGYVYDGYFIDAFTDEMKDKKSQVYYLNESALSDIKNIIDTYRNKAAVQNHGF